MDYLRIVSFVASRPGGGLLTHVAYGRFSNSANCGRRFENYIPDRIRIGMEQD